VGGGGEADATRLRAAAVVRGVRHGGGRGRGRRGGAADRPGDQLRRRRVLLGTPRPLARGNGPRHAHPHVLRRRTARRPASRPVRRPDGYHLSGRTVMRDTSRPAGGPKYPASSPRGSATPAAPDDRGNFAFDGNYARVVRVLFPPDERFPRRWRR